MEAAAKKAWLNVEQFKIDFENQAKTLLEEDLKLTREFGVRGFPTSLFFFNSGNQEVVYGTKPYPFYETAVLKLNPSAHKSQYNKSWENLLSKYHSLTAKELSELSGTPSNESEKLLNELSDKGILEKLTTKNGAIWKLKNTSR